MKNLYFYIRRIEIENVTALHPGSGESDILQDMPVQVDYNGLPTLNGTSIAGALRGGYESKFGEDGKLFGSSKSHDKPGQHEQSMGSRLTISNAVVLDENARPVEALSKDAFSDYLTQLQKLPQRDHCRINALGSAQEHGKFDRTVLPAGVRFLLEYVIENHDRVALEQEAEQVAAIWNSPEFRLGGGSRNGFGKIKILKENERIYDLSDSADREAYLSRRSSLSDKVDMHPVISASVKSNAEQWTLKLKPENFWITSDGCDDGEVNFRSKREIRFVWDSNGPKAKEFLLLPATSIKGALSHRTAYHYNRLKGIFADQLSDEAFKEQAESRNKAVATLFGEAKDKEHTGSRGKVLLDDLVCAEDAVSNKVFNHVAIDRFTGGARKGMLFSEEAVFGGEFTLTLTLEPGAETEMVEALKSAWNDLKNGLLPLGGGVMRGHGVMQGTEEA